MGGKIQKRQCSTSTPWGSGQACPTRSPAVMISSRSVQTIVPPSHSSASHHPQVKKLQKNGPWSSRSASRVISYVHRITYSLSLNRERRKFSRILLVDDLILPLCRSINVHLLNLLDGSPHEVPLQGLIALDLGYYRNRRVIDTQISDSRIALVIEASSFTMARRRTELIAWDWKTGEVVSDFSSWETGSNPTSTQVLEHSSDDPDYIGGAISNTTSMCFLEGSWLLSLFYTTQAPQLLVFNTLVPQWDPMSWRALDLPPLPSHDVYRLIFTQYEKLEGLPTECPEFSVDPAQKIFVVFSQGRRVLTISVELLVRQMHSTRVNPCIPWDEWREDVVTAYLHPDVITLQLFDTKLLALRGSAHFPESWGVQMYDLSKSGRKDIRVQQASEGEGGCNMAISTPKWFARCQMEGIRPYSTHLFGNAVIHFIVSPRYIQKCSCSTSLHQQRRPLFPGGEFSLRIWKMGWT